MAASHTKAETEAQAPRREYGEGSICPLAAGGYRGSLLVTDRITGKRTRRYVSGPSRFAVSRKLEKVKADAARGEVTASRLTVAAYLATWLEAERARVRPSTWRQREQYVRTHIAERLGTIRLARLQPAEMAGVGRTWMYEALAAGRIRSVKLGRRRLVPSDALAELVAGER